METGKYVSDVFDIDEAIKEHGNKILLVAGVGAGKSSWVKDVLTQKGNVLFITSRRAKVDEDINDSIFTSYLRERDREHQTLMTNAKLTHIFEKVNMGTESMTLDEFMDYYDYVVIDEVHSMAADAIFAESAFGLFTFIRYLEEKGKTVIAMTGTPEPVQDYFNENNWHTIDLRKRCNYVTPAAIYRIKKDDLITQIKSELEKNKKIVYFVNRTDTIKTLLCELDRPQIVKMGSVAAIVSKNKEDKLENDLTEILGERNEKVLINSKEVYRSIIEEKKLPNKCKILLSTSKLKEGVDIVNDEVTIFCDNHILTNIIQFCGRVRVGNGVVYIIEDVREHPVNQDKLLYDYGRYNEAAAANCFLKDYIEKEWNWFIVEEKGHLITHVIKNPYIFFNYIEDEFEVFHMKYEEEARLKKCEAMWIEMLNDYCAEFGIETNLYMSPKQRKAEAIEIIEDYANVQLFDRELRVKVAENAFKVLGVPKERGRYPRSVSKIAEKLKEYGMPYELISRTESAGEHRNQTYWMYCSKSDTE